MSLSRQEQTLALHTFNENQSKAVTTQGRDLMITAGAGSGKTRTLVGRYLYLLAGGESPRRVVAVTFTEKAAREMRNRIRKDIETLKVHETTPPEDRPYWESLAAQIDGARIGTIHGLCAEILRAHPAEAKLDPEFVILDETSAALYRSSAIESALAWAVEQIEMQIIFENFDMFNLRHLLGRLFANRLNISEISTSHMEVIDELLKSQIETADLSGKIGELSQLSKESDFIKAAGEKMAAQISNLLPLWEEAEALLQSGNSIEAAAQLYQARRSFMKLNIGSKTGPTREVLIELRERYDEFLNPLIGGKNAKPPPPDLALEEIFQKVQPLILQVFKTASAYYQTLKDQDYALDFDDLEEKTSTLLTNKEVSAQWQDKLSHILVDEFQDTNPRQRAIVRSLAGTKPGRFFAVGDARQSIYRFRGADVSVFTETAAEIKAQGGEIIDLTITFRSHQPLLNGIHALLEPIMGTEVDSKRPYAVPYSRLEANQEKYAGSYKAPFIEFILGEGENADEGRKISATATASRLVELKRDGQIKDWKDVALLFRASSGFPSYENALEESQIPFVTVAGSGFYQRPEIRDLLNITAALADPYNDTLAAGLLRSPAIGLSDVSLYQLRLGPNGLRPFYEGLANYESLLPKDQHPAAEKALALISDFAPRVNHLPVAALLAQLVNFLDYRAVLASGSGRLARNLDKLLIDARGSGLVQVSDFLEYIRSMRDVEIRTGEAALEIQDSVQLMTIHKSKGLEFPLVVLADAGRQLQVSRDPVYLHKELGMVPKLAKLEGESILFNYAQQGDKDQDTAESHRLLYVASTRDQEKLIISSHLAKGRSFIKLLLGDKIESLEANNTWQKIDLGNGEQAGLIFYDNPPIERFEPAEAPKTEEKPKSGKSIYKPLSEIPVAAPTSDPAEEDEVFLRTWRATKTSHPPGAAVGKLVHRALQRWSFPGDAGYDELLLAVSVGEELANEKQRNAAFKEVEVLLKRFKKHPLFIEIDTAQSRAHEIPYAVPNLKGKAENGIIDLLLKSEGQWGIVDFKTDEITSDEELDRLKEQYALQLNRYKHAVRHITKQEPEVRLCFLNVKGAVKIEQF